MLISFTLGMPNVGSWNGKWSGEKDYYAQVRSVKPSEETEAILKQKRFYYSFGDGWCASVRAERTDSKEAAKIRRKSKGFCSYDWMIDSIIEFGDIRITK